MDKELLQSTVSKVLDEMRQRPIPLGVSNRHIHLSAQDYERLFPGHPISEKKALLQPGQYAAENVRQPEGDAGHPPGQPLCRTGATFRGYRRAAAYPYVAA